MIVTNTHARTAIIPASFSPIFLARHQSGPHGYERGIFSEISHITPPPQNLFFNFLPHRVMRTKLRYNHLQPGPQ